MVLNIHGAPRKYCVSCAHDVELERRRRYARAHVANILEWKRRNPDKVHSYAKKLNLKKRVLRQAIAEQIYGDALMHPRKWLRKVRK